MDPNIILSIATSIAGVSVLLLYRGLANRLDVLETGSNTKVEAERSRSDLARDLDDHAKRDDEQFQAVQASLRDTRAEMREAFTAFRNEANEKRTEMRNDMLNLRGENTASFARIYDLIERKSATARKR